MELLEHIQDDLYRIMSIIGYEGKCPPSCKMISRDDVEFLEISGDEYDVGDLSGFTRPGGDELGARINLARSVCRRAERSVVKLEGEGGIVLGDIIQYLNRLSDLLFGMGYR